MRYIVQHAGALLLRYGDARQGLAGEQYGATDSGSFDGLWDWGCISLLLASLSICVYDSF